MNEKLRKRIYYSLLISLAIHLCFVIWSFFVKIVPFNQVTDPQKVIHVKLAKEESIGEEAPNAEASTSAKTKQQDDPFKDMETLVPSTESKEKLKENIDSAIQDKKEPLVSSSPQEIDRLKPQMSDTMTAQKVRRATRKNLVDVGELPTTDFASGAPVVVPGEDITKDYLDKGSTAMKVAPVSPVQGSSGQSTFQMMKRTSTGISRKSKTVDLGTSLTYELSTYQDPEGQKYFKLLVKVRDATLNFAVIPKEIIFLIDASNSIGEARLKQFEEGLSYSLNHLNPDDRFNLIIFKDKTIVFSPTSMKADPVSVQRAIAFLRTLKSGERTDVYGALETSLKAGSGFTPSYRVLITDGFPTTGIVNAREVINKIAKINNGKVGIFAFGGGAVSRYMLDFVAYKNHGWSNYKREDHLIGKGLSNFYNEIKDPLLLNLRYHVSGLNENDVYPRMLPDFFKGSEMVIYGKYTNENKIFLQVLGNILGETKEFTVNAALNDAKPGDKSIARNWAFHKIYYLIGELKYNENNQDLIKDIDTLQVKYQIITPYSRNFREIPKAKPVPRTKPQPKPPAPTPQPNISK
jgi:hypothetical protein